MSLSYLEREFVRRLRHRRGTHYNRYLGPMGEKANQFAAAIREIDKLEGRFVAPSDVAAVADRLESWSRLVFEHLSSGAGR